MLRLRSLLALLVLTACALPSSQQWSVYSDHLLGVSLEYPSRYTPEEAGPNIISYGATGAITVVEAYLRESEEEAVSIHILRTADSRILHYVGVGNSLKVQSINGSEIAIFHWEGMGDPVGYVFRDGTDWVVLSLTFPPDDATVARIVGSMRFDRGKSR